MTIAKKPLTHLRPKFVRLIPEKLEERVLYISIAYSTAVHSCPCGCGTRVVTPIHPTEWSLTWNGEGATLHPSVGNWSSNCRSHYWIRENQIVWAMNWSAAQVERARKAEDSDRRRLLDLRRHDGQGA
jgi:uncharacterized protein DUF6527